MVVLATVAEEVEVHIVVALLVEIVLVLVRVATTVEVVKTAPITLEASAVA